MTDAEMDAIYDRIDSLLWQCHHNGMNFKPIDDILRGIDVENSGVDLLLTYLILSRPAASHLKYRKEFWKRVKKRIKALDRDWRELIGGLK